MHVLAFLRSTNSRGKSSVFAAIWQPESAVWQLQWHRKDFVISSAITNLICVGIVVFVIRCELVCFKDCQRNLLCASSWNKHGFSSPHMSVSLNFRLYWRLQHCWCQEIFVLFWLQVFSLCLWRFLQVFMFPPTPQVKRNQTPFADKQYLTLLDSSICWSDVLLSSFTLRCLGALCRHDRTFMERGAQREWEKRENSSELKMVWEGWWR